MRVIIAGLILILFSHSSVFAATLKSEGAAEALCVEVMSALQKEDVSEAFLKMKSYMDIPDAEFKVIVEKSKARHDKLQKRFGKTIGYEFIGGKMVGTSLLRLQYLEKTDRHVLPWSFYYYKTPKGWKLNTFSWGEDFKSLF